MSTFLTGLATSVEAQGLNSLIAGFSFASALAWYGVVQSIIEKFVKSGTGIQAHLIAALLTTVLSIIVFMIIKATVKEVKINEPAQPLFAVTR
jgi:hypothetical protein